MKKVIKYYYFWTIIYILISLIINNLLLKCNYELLNWIKYFKMFIITFGIIISTIQLLKKKTTICSIIVILEVVVILIVNISLLISYNKEEIIVKDNKKMIKVTHTVLLSNWIKYYDYKNIFVRSRNERIYEAYDDSLGEYLYTVYYDENGKLLKTINK